MKILITHNDYGRPSGEEAAVNSMGELMAAHGHPTYFYRPSTEAYQSGLTSKIRIFVSGVYSWHGVRGIQQVIKKIKPDIVNVHNLYPFISPAALFACKAAGIPVVMTVHNYRLMCPTGLFLRDGRPCELCLTQGNEWGCVRHNCEKNIGKSAGYALRTLVARKTGAYQKNVDRFVCLTEFQRTKLIEAGYDPGRITVIANRAPEPLPFCEGPPGGGEGPGECEVPGGCEAPGQYIAYVGRLSKEKGWDLLIGIARKNPQVRIKMAGFGGCDGNELPGNVELAGRLDLAELVEFYRGARFVVVPSRAYEGFPMVALEAMAMGKPVIAPNHGGFPEIIGSGAEAVGYLFQPNVADDLEAAILKLWNDERLIWELGRKGVEKVRAAYSSEIIYRRWERLFGELLNG